MQRRSSRALFPFCVIVLAGCGGGSGTAVSPVAPTLSHATERIAAQTALSALRPQVFEANIVNSGLASSATLGSARRRVRRKATAATCTAGNTTGPTATGTTSFTTNFYYDAACTQLWRNLAGTIAVDQSAPFSPNFSESTATYTQTVHSLPGQEVEVDQVTSTMTTTAQGTSEALSVSAGPNAQSIRDRFIDNCSNSPSASGCSYGDLQFLQTADPDPAQGVSVADTVTQFDSLNAFTATSLAAIAVQGASAVTTFSPVSFPFITGGSAQENFVITRVAAADNAEDPTSISLTLSDARDDVSSAISYDEAFTISGSVLQLSTSSRLASLSVDVNGYGTIEYSDGSSGTIAAFAVQQ